MCHFLCIMFKVEIHLKVLLIESNYEEEVHLKVICGKCTRLLVTVCKNRQ